MDFDAYKTLGFFRRERVLTVTITSGVVDKQMHAELARVFHDISGDPDSDTVVLTGVGRSFSSGGDLDWFQEMIDDPRSWDKNPSAGQADHFRND